MGNSKSHLSGYEDGTLEINLSNFKLLRVVGKGSYGKVFTQFTPLFFCRSVSLGTDECVGPCR
jgi:hypothetical protein